MKLVFEFHGKLDDCNVELYELNLIERIKRFIKYPNKFGTRGKYLLKQRGYPDKYDSSDTALISLSVRRATGYYFNLIFETLKSEKLNAYDKLGIVCDVAKSGLNACDYTHLANDWIPDFYEEYKSSNHAPVVERLSIMEDGIYVFHYLDGNTHVSESQKDFEISMRGVFRATIIEDYRVVGGEK